MRPGTHVVYTARHWQWLEQANRHPQKYERARWIGEVTGRRDALLDAGPACVLWPDGRETWHLLENLEVPG